MMRVPVQRWSPGLGVTSLDHRFVKLYERRPDIAVRDGVNRVAQNIGGNPALAAQIVARSTSMLNGYGIAHDPALGIVPTPMGQQVENAPAVRPLSLTEAIIASVAVSVISGVISSWFFDKARVPAMVKKAEAAA